MRAASGGRVRIHLDGGPALLISAVSSYQLGLRRGTEVDEASWAAACARARAEAAEAAGVRLLAARGRTAADLRRRLARRFPPEAVEEALAHLRRIGAIEDDAAFAERWLQSTAATGLASRARLAALLRMGVAPGTARRAVQSATDPAGEADAALAAARRVAARYASLPPEQGARRLWAYLGRRGFTPEQAARAVRHALGDAVPEGGSGA